MKNIGITNARNNLYKIVSSCIKNDEVFCVSAKNGNVVMISENRYNNMIESLYLSSIKDVKRDIKTVVNTPTRDFIKNSPWE